MSLNESVNIDFFGVGPQRTASSWLHEVLSNHPGIAFPEGVKETMFFDQRYEKGLEWYRWHFKRASTSSVIGEIAPTYFDCSDAAERIFEHFPLAKIIINVRNPIEQSYSLFRHHYSKGRVSADFHEAARAEPRILTAAHYRQHSQIWEKLFGDRVCYLIQEDVRTSPEQVIGSVYGFLGVVPVQLPDVAHSMVNVADAPRSRWLAKLFSSTATQLRSLRLHRLVGLGKMLGLNSVYRGGKSIKLIDQECFEFLLGHFESDICWLESRFERDFSAWRVNRTKVA